MVELPRILILSPSDLATDPRVNRQLRLLRSLGRITAAGLADPELEQVEFVSLAFNPAVRGSRVQRLGRLATRQFRAYYDALPWVQKARAALKGRSFDVVIANDAESWPLGLELRGSGRTLFDAHEYTPREFEHAWWWRTFYQPYKIDLCRKFLRRADGVLTVCPGIADEYAREFGIRPIVVMNVPEAAAVAPSPVTGDKVRMIHHGGANPSRKIELMIQMLDHLDARFTLDLLLVPSDPRYVAYLRQLAAPRPRVRFLDPVPMRSIAETINRYDIGLYLLEPNSFNNRHALPNKFFEYIQARLGVAIGPSPEMARITTQEECGVVATSFQPETLAAALQAVTPDQLARWKQNSDRAAQRLCWEQEGLILRREVERLLSLGPCAA
ncbi:MAG: glycosyltransferase [Verrucomicrobiota bacterium]